MLQQQTELKKRKFPFFCAVLTFFVGLISLLGWILHAPLLGALFLPLIPIHYFSAVGFCLCGGALLLIIYNRYFSSLILSAILIFFALMYIGSDFIAYPLMPWAARSVWGVTVISFTLSQLFFNSLASFLLMGSSLFLLAVPAQRKNILFLSSQILASLVFIIAANGLASFFTGFYVSTPILSMFPHTAITLILISIAVFEHTFFLQKKQGIFHNRLVFLVNIIISLVALQFYHFPQILLVIIPSIVVFNVGVLFYLNKKINELRVSEKKLHSVIESCQDAIVSIDSKSLIVAWNAAAENLFGYSKQEAIGQLLTMIMPERYRERHLAGLNRLLESHKPKLIGKTIQMEGIRKTGEEFPVELSLAMWEHNGEVFFTGIVRDITERLEAENLTKKAMQLAEEASRMKSEFLANMSHEIRTPMTSILGYTDLLLNPSLSTSSRLDFIQIIRRNGQHLLQIINDILDLAKIEAGKLTISRSCFTVHSVVTDVISLMRQHSFEKGILLSVEYLTPIPEKIFSDPYRLKQILINLIGNATKFTEKGKVLLTVQMKTTNQDPVSLIQFDVIDTGIGMTEEQLKTIFQPFVQAEASISRRFGGTGLGLTIVKHLVHLLGGELTCKSELGKGSTFTCTIETGPLDSVRFIRPDEEIMEEKPSVTHKIVQLKGQILLAEDGEDNRRLITYLLNKIGLEVAVVENGKAAYEKAMESLTADKPYDIILMDMQMPVMDGYAATSLLRSKGYKGMIIALTAFAMAEDKNKCLSVGCNDVITKPIDFNSFIQTLQSHLESVNNKSPQTEEPNTIYSTFSDNPIMEEMVQVFVSNLPGRVAAIEDSLSRSEIKAVQVLAHQLKGAAGSYGFPQISEIAARLELLCANTDSKEEVLQVFEELKKTCAKVHIKH